MSWRIGLGFGAARRQALAYAAGLRGQLARLTGYSVEDLEDASRISDGRRKRDLEATFLSFGIETDDGRWHDAALTGQFRVALLRADQERDQLQARSAERRQDGRRERFRQSLDALLAGDAYAHLDAATKERLLAEVTALAFASKARGI
jgi:hypothetical protein